MLCRLLLLSLTLPPRDLGSLFYHQHIKLNHHASPINSFSYGFQLRFFLYIFSSSFNIPLWIWLSISQVNFKLIYFDVRSDQTNKINFYKRQRHQTLDRSRGRQATGTTTRMTATTKNNLKTDFKPKVVCCS